MKKIRSLALALVLPLLALTATGLVFPVDAHAADARSFRPGRIIDDAVFTNSNSMTVEQIQVFLNSKMPNCDTYGTGGGAYTNRSWIENNLGISPPYRCLNDYRENPTTGANNYGTWTNPSGSLSAAELIYQYARQFNINPQVLIVTLQKENGLVTDYIPIPRQYQQAMGYGCPDNVAPGQPVCDPAYNSFSNQLYQAARHFRGYMNNTPGWYYLPTGWNDIMWDPDQPRCGTTPVYIENRATAALYTYTPYQPNQAALNAGYGLGDSCSAYGNRNFYLYFTDWFGSTQEEFRYAFEPMVGSGSYSFNADVSALAKKTITIGDSIYTLFGDAKSHTLQLLLWNGSGWSRTILDGPGSTSIGSVQTAVNPTAIEAFSYGDTIQYYYIDSATNTLKHGFTMRGSFAVETLDGTPTSYLGKSRTLGSAISGTPYGNGIQLFYYNTGTGELIHTFILGGMWATETMDGSSTSIARNTINAGKRVSASDINGRLIVIYYDDATGFTDGHTSSWRFAYTSINGGGWITGILDGGSTSSRSGSSLSPALNDISMVGYGGTVQVFYNNSTDALMHVWFY